MTAEIVPFPQSLTKEAALSIIRAAAIDSDRIGWSDHAHVRMEDRGVTMRQALDTLRNGKIIGGPKLDEYEEWKVTLRKRSAGRLTRVAVAIKEGSQNLTVLTVI